MNMEQKNSDTIYSDPAVGNLSIYCHYQFENGSSQMAFLEAENGSEGFLVNNSLSFYTENFVQTIASSNGLLLLSGYREDQICYYVFNPLTRDSIIIPQPCFNPYVAQAGLAFDGNQFHVVLVEAVSLNGLELQVFSSGINKWRKSHHPIDLSVPFLPKFEFQELGVCPLYSNGAIHWEIGGHLLVYKVKDNQCELYELPNRFDDWSWQSTMTYRRCLCESGGRVYYCYTDFDGFHVWDFLRENDHHRFYSACYDPKKFCWRLVHSVRHEIFFPKHLSKFGHFIDWEPYKITPIAYDEESQTIFLQLPGIVVSYNFDSGILSSMCSYSYPGMNFNCCSFLPFVASGICSMQKERKPKGNTEMAMNLPMAEVEKISFLA